MKSSLRHFLLTAPLVPILLANMSASAQRPPIEGGQAAVAIAGERDRVEFEPHNFQWSPSGRILTFVRGLPQTVPGRPSQPLLEICAENAESDKEEVLVSPADLTAIFGREPSRLPEEEEEGPPHTQLLGYSWATDSRFLLLYTRDSLGWFDSTARTGRLLLQSQDIADPKISPDGKFVSFIRNHTLWTVSVSSGTAHPFSPIGTADLLEGEPDWLYSRELKMRSAYWWSPDSRAIAWIESDDRSVDKYSLRKSNGDEYDISFPKPGGHLPGIRLRVGSVGSPSKHPTEIGAWTDAYVPVVRWLPDAKHIAIEHFSRDQKTLLLTIADTAAGSSHAVLTEKDPYWINLEDDLYFLRDSKRFIWSSERSGFRHLYLYDVNGRQLGQLTHGNWEVNGIAGFNESKSEVYFTATEASVIERQLYAVKLDGSGFRRITRQHGTHSADLSPDGNRFIDLFSNSTTPPEHNILDLDGVVTARVSPRTSPAPDSQNLTSTTEFLTFKNHVGAELNASFTRPANFSAEKKYPVILFVAGGPGEQVVRDAWGGDIELWLKTMAQLGYIIFSVDNHGTTGRGHLFEEPVHLRFASQEMSDIRDAVLYLDSLPSVDHSRIGICGFGFGGFLALHGMLDKPILFKAGFAGEPISDWHFYDAFFAERYLGAPDRNQDGWLASSPLENAKNLENPLLIAQATLDEKFHIENSLALLDELLDKSKYADLLLLPDRHSLFDDKPERSVLFSRLTLFFLKNL